MKRPGLFASLLAATLFLLAGSGRLMAAEARPGPAGKAAKKSRELLERFDRNGDGKLDDDERAAAKDAMMQEQLDRQMARIAAGGTGPAGERFRATALALFDRNKDGRLDDDERAEAQRFAEARQDPAALKGEVEQKFDRNGDGRLDDAERREAGEFLAELRNFAGQRLRQELLREFDRNANGRIDDAEMTALEKSVRPRLEANPQQRRLYDANRDGKLDEAEWRAARVRIGAWLNEGGPAALAPEAPRADKR